MNAAEEHNYMVIVLNSEESYELERKQIDRLLRQNVDGILMSIADSTHDLDHINKIIKQNIPLVFFDKYSKLSDCSSVIINDQKAAFTAVEHLIKQGKKTLLIFVVHYCPKIRLIVFWGTEKHWNTMSFLNKEWVFRCDHISSDEGYAYAKRIVEHHPEIDAIFAVADMPAIGAIKYLTEQNITIPEQIAVMGFSNWKISNLITPALSTVNQPGESMGHKAFELFYNELQQIKKGKTKRKNCRNGNKFNCSQLHLIFPHLKTNISC